MRQVIPLLVLAALTLTVPWSERRVIASPGAGLRIVDAAGNTPVVNEGGRVALRVVDGSGSPVSVSSWSSDNKAVGKVKRTNGLLRGKAFGFATVTAQTSQGAVSGFVVCARVRRQNGAMTQGDTKTDVGGNVYLSSPTKHVLYRATAASADVFAGQSGVSGYQEGTGGGVRFNGPAGIGVDNRAEGGLYVADTANHCIRKVDFRGRSSLAAGTPGFEGTMFGDDNPMSEAVLNGPRGVASVGANLYVTDTGNHCVWYVDVQRQRVQLVAGEPGEAGNANGEGRVARFDSPSGIAVNTRGNLLAVADTGNNVVRLIAIAPRSDGEGVIGQVTTLGLGSSARNARILEKLGDDRGTDQITFEAPVSVSFDGVDNVYVIDRQSASVVTRPSAASGRPVERVDLAQVGTLGDPASVTVRRTQAFVLDEAATTDATAVNVVEVGAPTIRSVTPDTSRLEGGQQVTITGTNFAPESKLTLGDAEITAFNVDSSTRITFTVPAQQVPGARTLSVATRGGVAQRVFRVLTKHYRDLQVGEITTIGGGVQYLGDGGSATEAILPIPGATALDGSGNLYVIGANRIRQVQAASRTITTYAGSGNRNFSGDGGDALLAGIAAPQGVAVDGTGNVYVSDATRRIRRIDAVTKRISTIAGTGLTQPLGDGGPALDAAFYYAAGLAIDPDGNLLVADYFHSRIRRIDLHAGTISTVAGSADRGFGGDGGLATNAKLYYPSGVASDANGNIYVADSSNHAIRRVDASTGVISTVAGTGEPGSDGDGGPATSSRLDTPMSVVVGGDGAVFIADTLNNRVRKIDPTTGTISAFAGDGRAGFGGDCGPATECSLFEPAGLSLDAAGNLLIADRRNHRVRMVDAQSQRISTVAGSGPAENGDGGPCTLASFEFPDDIAFDEAGNLFVADGTRIRRIDGKTGIITTIAGTGESGYSGDGGPATAARFRFFTGLALDEENTLFVSDVESNVIRRIDLTTGVVTTYAGTGESGFTPDGALATEASFQFVVDLEVDASGGLLLAEEVSFRVRRIDPVTRRVTTFAGNGLEDGVGEGGPAVSVSIIPGCLSRDGVGNVIIGDSGFGKIRRVGIDGTIHTLAGTGIPGYSGDGGPALSARIAQSASIAVDGAGNVFVAGNGNRIRRIDATTGIIDSVAGTGEPGYSGDGGPALQSRMGYCFGLSTSASGDLIFSDTGNRSLRLVRGIAVPNLRGRDGRRGKDGHRLQKAP